MKYQEITESVQIDIQMGSFAQRCALAISQGIYNGADYKHVEFADIGEFFLYDLGEFKFPAELHNVCILLGLKKPNTVGMSGAVANFTEQVFEKYNRGILVYGMQKMTSENARRLANSTAFLDTCAHEVLHVLDALRDEKIMNRGNLDSTNQLEYFNDPAEFNAYYHDIVSSLTDIASQKPEDIRDYAELYQFNPDVTAFIRSALHKDHFSQAFWQWLTEPRKKALLKRIYRLHQHVAGLIAQADQAPSVK